MNNDKTRKFTWNDSEASNQESAYERMNEIASEYEIETFFSGGEQFAERIRNAGLDYNDFTIEDFSKWKANVVDIVLGALIEAERSAFDQLLIEKQNKFKPKKKNLDK